MSIDEESKLDTLLEKITSMQGDIKDIQLNMKGDPEYGTIGYNGRISKIEKNLNGVQVSGQDGIAKKVEKHDRQIRDARIATLAIVIFFQGVLQGIASWWAGHGNK